MKNLTLKLAILGALSISASSAMAAFVTLPTSGATAYTTCFAGANFGTGTDGSWPPAAGACVAPNGGGAALLIASVPEAGFTAFAAGTATTAITAFAETVATLNERVWRNAGTSQCIYGKQVIMNNAAVNDYNPQKAGAQKLEVNDYAFGGYTGAVSAAYAKQLISYSSAFRIGRTFTSVQMQANPAALSTPAPGFKALPTTAAALGTEITGVGQTRGATGVPPGANPGTVVPTAGQQDAPFSTNWVDFTVDVTAGVDEDNSTNPASPNMYIKQSCAAGTTTATAGNFKIRQTGQETQPWITVTGTSRAPGTSTAP